MKRAMMRPSVSKPPPALEPMMNWMKGYTEARKTLMDLADASLVWLGDRLDSTQILTEDRRDFLRYRLPDGRGFEILQ